MKAFPSGLQQTGERFEENPLHEGMDLRDHFAGLAMQAIISNDDAMKYVNMVLKGMSAERGVSILSYRYADEMLEARNAK